jgi:hypothetical protein
MRIRCLCGREPELLIVAGALWALLAPSPVAADDVHLTNGNTFEDVIATVDGDEVRIRLPHGEIALPVSRVQRIVKADTALQEYLDRERALCSAQADAAQWLELARWARAHGLDHSARESALRAARLDPRLEGLEDVLGPYGYLYSEELHRWLTYDESMERRGYVYYQGGWVRRADLEDRLRRLEEEQQRRRAERAEATAQLALEAAIEARVQAEVAREVARSTVQYPGLIYGYPAVVGSFFVPVQRHLRGPGDHPGRGSLSPGARAPHGAPRARDRGDRGPRTRAPQTRVPPRRTVNVFAPPPGELLEQRDFGAGLGIDLPNGYGGAPGQLHHQP